MDDRERIMKATDEELIQNLFGHEPTSRPFVQSKAVLELRTSARMASASKRIECATWIILAATLAMLAVASAQLFFYR